MNRENSLVRRVVQIFILPALLLLSSIIYPLSVNTAEGQVTGSDTIRPVPADSDEMSILSSSSQPWVAAYHDPVPDHFAAYKTKITCNFSGTDRTKIQSDNFLACSQALQSPTNVRGLDYGITASVTFKRTGSPEVTANVWRACESQPGVECSPAGSVSSVSSDVQTITASVSDDIALFMEWSTSGSTLTWYYQVGSGTKTEYHSWTKPESEGHVRFNTGVCFISWPDCADFFILRTARYFQAGVSSEYPIGQAGWFVTIKNPAYAATPGGSYNSYFAPARVTHGDDAFFDNDFRWGGEQYTGVNADYNEIVGSVPKGQVKFYHTGTTITHHILLWNGLPQTIATTTSKISPDTGESYEGEKRIIDLKGVTQPSSIDAPARYLFYYDGSNIVYRKSNNGGETWGSATSLETGALVSDNYRWSVVQTTHEGTQYVYIFYWVQGNPDTQNAHFKLIRGIANSDGTNISWSAPLELGFTSANSTECGTGGVCAAVTTATDSNGAMYAAFRWKSGGASTYSYQIKASTNGGWDWFDSLGQQDSGSSDRISMALTKLESGKMLFAFGKKNSGDLFYRVFDGTSWGPVQSRSASETGWTTSTVDKQISAASDSSGNAYVAYVTAGTSGNVKVAKFLSSGSFSTIETPPNGGLSHSLPSVQINADNEIYVYTVASARIYSTEKEGGSWQNPTNPFGTTFNTPNQLTVGTWDNSLVWKEGTSNVRHPHGY